MRIAVLSLDFVPGIGGVQRYLHEIGMRLAASHEVIAITPSPGPVPPGSPVEKLVLRESGLLAFRGALRRARPDLVVVGHAHPRLLVAAWTYGRSPYAAIAHGNDFLAAQRRWHRPIFNGLLRRARPLLSVSEACSERLENVLGMPPRAWVPPGADPVRFHPAAEVRRESTVLLTVSRLVASKGIDTAVRALSILGADFPRLEYRIVGDGPDRARLEHLRDRLGLARSVTFCGAVPHEDLPSHYRAADVFVLPVRGEPGTDRVEAFGIVYLEASASGLPIVATRQGGVAEAVRDGETGLLVQPADAEAVAGALRRLLTDGELRHKLGRNGRRWVESTMNWDRAAREMERLLTDAPGTVGSAKT